MPSSLSMDDSPAPEDSDAGPNTTLPLPAEPPHPTPTLLSLLSLQSNKSVGLVYCTLVAVSEQRCFPSWEVNQERNSEPSSLFGKKKL